MRYRVMCNKLTSSLRFRTLSEGRRRSSRLSVCGCRNIMTPYGTLLIGVEYFDRYTWGVYIFFVVGTFSSSAGINLRLTCDQTFTFIFSFFTTFSVFRLIIVYPFFSVSPINKKNAITLPSYIYRSVYIFAVLSCLLLTFITVAFIFAVSFSFFSILLSSTKF